jgi:hypothetical protein
MDLIPHAAVQVVRYYTFCKNSIASFCPKDVHFFLENKQKCRIARETILLGELSLCVGGGINTPEKVPN